MLLISKILCLLQHSLGWWWIQLTWIKKSMHVASRRRRLSEWIGMIAFLQYIQMLFYLVFICRFMLGDLINFIKQKN